MPATQAVAGANKCIRAIYPISIGVKNRPGAMVLIRIPLDANSRAMGSVMPTTAALLAEYAA